MSVPNGLIHHLQGTSKNQVDPAPNDSPTPIAKVPRLIVRAPLRMTSQEFHL